MKEKTKENEEIIVEEILKKCKWWEKVIVSIFTKQFIKCYNIARINTNNSFLI